MNKASARGFRRLRILSQTLFTLGFLFLVVVAGRSETAMAVFRQVFAFDPLLALGTTLAGRVVGWTLGLSLLLVLLTLVFGRFFCGWICPLGSLWHATGVLLDRSPWRKRTFAPKWLRGKTFVLIGVLAASFFTTQVAGWLDPLSFFARTVSTSLFPPLGLLLETLLRPGAAPGGIVAPLFRPAYQAAHRYLLPVHLPMVPAGIVIGLLLLGLVILHAVRRRIYCNSFCPLGALLGWVARFSFLRLKVRDKCLGCQRCQQRCTYNGGPYQHYLPSECMLCMNCLADCPDEAVGFSWRLAGWRGAPVVDFNRRRLASALAGGLFLGALPQLEGIRRRRTRRFVRPPGSVAENQFLALCVRCGACVRACPTGVIQPALLEAGLEAMWTPVMVPAIGYCEYECHRCTTVCPTGAIAHLTLPEKKAFKMGTAVIDRSRCYTYADGYNCAVCEEHCPIPEKAIRLRDVEVANFRGKLKRVSQVYVRPDLCTGCGICENVCPRTDSPAIRVGAEEEQRAIPD